MDAYQIVETQNFDSIISAVEFSDYQKQFENAYLDKTQYAERLEAHRRPQELKNEMLMNLNQLLITMHQRPEMRDIDEKVAGYVPGRVKELWIADKKIRSCYDAIIKYCALRSADTNSTLIHMAEYKALYTVFRKIQRSLKVIKTINLDHPKPITMKKTVHPIHFEDLSWSQFEWLIFAFVRRLRTWDQIEWFGQLGHDEGEDIWGESAGATYCYLCANYKSLTLKKGKDDVDKLVKFNRVPDFLIVVCGGKVAASINKGIREHAQNAGIKNVEIWSGPDLEENIREKANDLLERFFEGISFPKTAPSASGDKEIIDQLADCFDRPAFTTPFYREVNIPDFGKAITDTIEVLNTGVHRLRDGTLIRNIPTRHQIQDPVLKEKIAAIYKLVVKLRDTFVELNRKKEIENCGCGDPDCPVYLLSDNACQKMDRQREGIFTAFRDIKKDFSLKLEK